MANKLQFLPCMPRKEQKVSRKYGIIITIYNEIAIEGRLLAI